MPASRRREVGLIVAAVLATGATGASASALISGSDILDGSITGRDVRNGSLTLSDLSEKSAAELAGRTGAPGANGPTGAMGPVGITGAAGPAGQVGATGPVGPAGVAGPAGAQGLIGPAGPAGEQGLIGPAGLAGAPGATGPAGPAGAQGATGPAGPQGLIGPAGPAGAQGATGPAGPQGATGPAGGAGTTGTPGAPGIPGTPGTPGTPGAAGQNGADGKTILNGTGAPAGAVGSTGDFYLDTTTTTLYGPKTTAWPATGVSLIGSGSGSSATYMVEAQVNAEQLMQSANATNVPAPISFGSEITDPEGAWAGDQFTAPTAGLYEVQVQVVSKDHPTPTSTVGVFMQLDVNGDVSGNRTFFGTYPSVTASNFPSGLKGRSSLSTTIKLAAGETFKINGLAANSSVTTTVDDRPLSWIKIIKLP